MRTLNFKGESLPYDAGLDSPVHDMSRTCLSSVFIASHLRYLLRLRSQPEQLAKELRLLQYLPVSTAAQFCGVDVLDVAPWLYQGDANALQAQLILELYNYGLYRAFDTEQARNTFKLLTGVYPRDQALNAE